MLNRGSLLIFILRVAVTGLFGLAGVLKLRDANATQMAIFQYKILSWEASEAAAGLLPMLEICAAAGLWLPRLRLGGATLCLGLTALFMGALGSAVWRNLDISCGCFGTTDLYTTAARRLMEDALIFMACIPLWIHAARRPRGNSQTGAVLNAQNS